jgi:hypothetical protein
MPFTSYPVIVDGQIVASEVIIQADENGYVEFALPRGSMFDFSIHGLETPGPEPLSEVTIPDAAGVEIMDLLFPYVKSVTYGVSSVTIAAGEEYEVTVTVVSSGAIDVEATDLTTFLEFTSADEDVAIVEVTDEGKILVRGVSAGATTLGVSRVAGTYAPRRPAVPDLELDPDPFDITVT